MSSESDARTRRQEVRFVLQIATLVAGFFIISIYHTLLFDLVGIALIMAGAVLVLRNVKLSSRRRARRRTAQSAHSEGN